MSFRGGFSRNPRGRGGPRRSFGNDLGEPDTVIIGGTVMHSCENYVVAKSSMKDVPYFNAPVYLKNKTVFGYVDEIFGPIHEYMFSIKLREGYNASSFAASSEVFLDPRRILPLTRFLPTEKPTRQASKPKDRGDKSFNDSFGNRSRGYSQARGFSGSRGSRGMQSYGGRGRGKPSFGSGGHDRGFSRDFNSGGRGRSGFNSYAGRPQQASSGSHQRF